MALNNVSTWLTSEKIKHVAILVGMAFALIFLCVGLKSCYDDGVVDEHETEVKAEVLERKQEADEKASEQRAKDSVANTKRDEERKDAIAKATDEPPSDASRRLGCERLRQAGYDTSRIPACQ